MNFKQTIPFYLIVLSLFPTVVTGQSVLIPLHHQIYQQAEINEIKNNSMLLPAMQPIEDKILFQNAYNTLSLYDSIEFRRFSNDSTISKKALLGKLYKNPADFYFHRSKNLVFHLNPSLEFSIGRDKNANSSRTTSVNSRGVEVKGVVDNRVGFFLLLSENQVRYPLYIDAIKDSTITIPYEGFWKQYKENGVDFLRAIGNINFHLSKSMQADIGYGKHFVGSGVRSLILSDYANNYPYFRLKVQTKIFDYETLFAEMIGGVRGGTFGVLGTGSFLKKYLSFHHFNIKLKPNLTIGLWESVIYGGSDNGLSLGYLNPIIFYRALEQQNGSADNVLLGLDFKWRIKEKLLFYGQLTIDEMKIAEVFSNRSWWGNKQAFQLGTKYTPDRKKRWLVQLELNKVRPYTYAHSSDYSNYAHYNLPLAHPLGANFTEYLFRSTVSIRKKWFGELNVVSAKYGDDLSGLNYGKDILKDTRTKTGEYNIKHLQGNETHLKAIYLRASYMWKHNLFFDGIVTYRQVSPSVGEVNNSTVFGVSLRWNSPIKQYLF